MNRIQFLRYNLWYYLTRPPWDTGISPPELLGFLADRPAGKALDLGCGTGTNVITLAKHGWQATGVDFAWKAIQIARRKAKKAGVKAVFHAGDVTRLENIFKADDVDPFDFILDIGCFHSLPEDRRGAYCTNLEKLLAKGGIFMLYGFLRESGQSVPGISQGDIDRFSTSLALLSREEGSDRAGERPSAWFTFQRQPTP